MSQRQVNARKLAYSYVVLCLKRSNWSPPIRSDEQIADVLRIPLITIKALKEGKIEPPKEIELKIRKLAYPMFTSEREIKRYLVDPFKV